MKAIKARILSGTLAVLILLNGAIPVTAQEPDADSVPSSEISQRLESDLNHDKQNVESPIMKDSDYDPNTPPIEHVATPGSLSSPDDMDDSDIAEDEIITI